MNRKTIRSNEKGFILLSSLFVTVLLSALAMIAYQRSIHEFKLVNREIDRTRAYYIAEAGIQNVMSQIAANAYTGFILVNPSTGVSILDEENKGNIAIGEFQDVNATDIGSFSVDINYINAADYVVLKSSATSGSESRTLEGRVFLESNFSKYLLFVDYPNFGSGDNAVYGAPTGDPEHPEGVAPHVDIRPNLYFTGDYQISGNNVQIYGDSAVEGGITQSTASSKIHGDTHLGDFQTDPDTGLPVNDGITGNVTVTDGYKDDADLDGDGIGPNPGDPDDLDDYPDRHHLDNGMIETLPQIDQSFYENPVHNAIPSFGTPGPTQTRYVRVEPDPAGGNFTVVREYNNMAYSTQVASYNLPKNAIVYVNGALHVKGQVKGRISFVSSTAIHFRGDMTYEGGSVNADANHSMAFLARSKLFFIPTHLTVGGIFYSENAGNYPAAFDASQKLNSTQSAYVTSGSKEYLRVHGNRLIVGQSNLSYYVDRNYLYDPNLKKYRPPGLPVVPDLQLVREI